MRNQHYKSYVNSNKLLKMEPFLMNHGQYQIIDNGAHDQSNAGCLPQINMPSDAIKQSKLSFS